MAFSDQSYGHSCGLKFALVIGNLGLSHPQNKVCFDLFVLSGLVDHFELNKQILSNFLSAVSALYRSVPYHNYNHVIHVLHTTWMVSGLTTVVCSN